MGKTFMHFMMCVFGILFLSSSAMALSLTDTVNGTHFIIDPNTLAVNAQISKDTSIIISTGLANAQISKLIQTNTLLAWQRDDAQIEAFIDKDVFVVRFTRTTPGDITWPQIPSGAKALILPLFEGSYIPTMDAQWRQLLQNEYQHINTTQDLSLPAIGFDYGNHVVSVIYANPFNNSIEFKSDNTGIAISSKHNFTHLDQSRSFEVRISINEKDLLAPAKRYRSWLQAQGQFVSLKNKLAAAPDGQKLIGASHIYIWGERLLTPRDVKNWGLLQQLIPATWLNQPNTREAAKASDIESNKYLQQVLIQTINQGLEQDQPGYSSDVFKKRREWILNTLGSALNPLETWGDVNPALMTQFKQAGLEKLWLGLPQWTAGFANPAGIKAARNAGYLIGPYDSYDTALPDGNSNPSWLSAQLGQETFLKCGILLENGKRKSGFQNEGVYTNPSCVRPLMEKRVQELQNELGFNSWFLDVDATGMVFDDFDPVKKTSQAQDAKNRIDGMAWIAKTLGIIVGSEDGHAVANSSIAFAQGTQVRGFGWRDNEMRKDKSSPFYLGAWFPSHQPDFFFKRASVKPEYQALYFNPARRLPLFQAAFHDSVITTNHWTLDNLKFKETQQTTELLQQLYNVPPMLNISLDTAATRLAYLKRIDRFFRPLHSRLYDQALVEFKYLTEDGLLQQTRFADGTVLLANFDEKAMKWNDKNIESMSLIAILSDGKQMNFDTNIKPKQARK